jgi:hypothetical protein
VIDHCRKDSPVIQRGSWGARFIINFPDHMELIIALFNSITRAYLACQPGGFP